MKEDLTPMLAAGDVDKIIIINREIARIYLKEDKVEKYKKMTGKEYSRISKTGPQFYLQVGDVGAFNTQVNEAQKDLPQNEKVDIRNDTEKSIFEILTYILPIILIIASLGIFISPYVKWRWRWRWRKYF